MAEQEFRQRRADGDGGLDIGLLADREDDAAHEAGDAGDFGDGDGDDDGDEAGAGEGDHGDGEEDAGDGHHAVHDAHGDGVDGAQIARGEADEEAREDAQHGHAQADGKGDARAVDGAGVEVAAIHVGAEPVVAARPLHARCGVERRRVAGREERREQRGGGEAGDDRGAEANPRMAAQRRPGAAFRTPGGGAPPDLSERRNQYRILGSKTV